MADPGRISVVDLLGQDVCEVQDVARQVVGDESAALLDWSVVALKGGAGGNPTSDAIIRVAGRARVDGDDRPWSAILKVVRSPVETGESWDDPGSAVYWRREVEVFDHRLLDEVRGVVVPRCYGTRELPTATAWLWLEDFGALERQSWGEREYLVAARALARFHAPYLTGTPIPDRPWLNRDFLRGFHRYVLSWFEPLLARARRSTGPLGRLDPARAVAPVASLMDIVADPAGLLAVLDHLPQTLSHNDTNIDNMLVRPGSYGPELVVLDWQMVGPGPIGADLGQLLCDVPELGPLPGAQVEAAVLRAYHEELTRCGAQVDLVTVQVAQSVDSLLRQCLWLVLLLCLRLEELAPEDDAGLAKAVEEFVDGVCASRLPRLVDQVADLVRLGPADGS